MWLRDLDSNPTRVAHGSPLNAATLRRVEPTTYSRHIDQFRSSFDLNLPIPDNLPSTDRITSARSSRRTFAFIPENGCGLIRRMRTLLAAKGSGSPDRDVAGSGDGGPSTTVPDA
ncbi:MAG: hypothetical protein JWM10_3051 [Myxococcaceae bacterium]|nr:hypothetical protein [Myxococcaceae bacterium]